MGLTTAMLSFLPQDQDNPIRYRPAEGTPTPAPPPAGAGTGTGTTATPQTPGSGAPPDPMSGCYQQLPILAAFGLIFYFLAIRPQQKTEKARREMLKKLTRGDRIVMNSGIHGVVAGITDDTVQVKIDSEGKVKITVERSAIGRVLPDEAAAKANAAASRDGVKDAAKE
jgi:preprotein translocase subunit YajC